MALAFFINKNSEKKISLSNRQNVGEVELGHIYAGTSELAEHEAITAPTAQYCAQELQHWTI